jgi:hypothetical protein
MPGEDKHFPGKQKKYLNGGTLPLPTTYLPKALTELGIDPPNPNSL